MNPSVSRSWNRGVAVDRGGRGGDDGRHPAVLRRDEDIERPGHVRLVRGEGVLHRPGHGGDGCLVEDAVRAREDLHEEVEVGDALLDERHPGMVEEGLDLLPAGPVARLSMMTTSWFCDKASARFEPSRPRR